MLRGLGGGKQSLGRVPDLEARRKLSSARGCNLNVGMKKGFATGYVSLGMNIINAQ